MFGFGFAEIVLITGLALVVIGPKRLPEVARAVGKGLSEFKGALDEVKRSVQQEVHKPIMDTKSEYLETILAERDKALKDLEGKPLDGNPKNATQDQPGPPPDSDASMGTPDDRKFSDLPYQNTEDDTEDDAGPEVAADTASSDSDDSDGGDDSTKTVTPEAKPAGEEKA